MCIDELEFSCLIRVRAAVRVRVGIKLRVLSKLGLRLGLEVGFRLQWVRVGLGLWLWFYLLEGKHHLRDCRCLRGLVQSMHLAPHPTSDLEVYSGRFRDQDGVQNQNGDVVVGLVSTIVIEIANMVPGTCEKPP